MADPYSLRAGDAPGLRFRQIDDMPPVEDVWAFVLVADLERSDARRSVRHFVGRSKMRALRGSLGRYVAVTMTTTPRLCAVERLPGNEVGLAESLRELMHMAQRGPGLCELHLMVDPRLRERLRDRMRDAALADAKPAGRA